MSGPPGASRPPPKQVAQPLTAGGITYQPDGAVVGEEPNRRKAYMVTAKDAVTGEKLWSVTVYEVDLVPGLEPDVQGRLFSSMELLPGGKQLLVVDERGGRFIVDLESREVTRSP